MRQRIGCWIMVGLLGWGGQAWADKTGSVTPDDLAVDYISMVRAARVGDLLSVAQLLERGIDPNGYSFEEWDSALAQRAALSLSPLQVAAREGHLEVVERLLEAGAAPDWCCCDCVTALHLAIDNAHEEVAERLIEAGADTSLPFSAPERRYADCAALAEARGQQGLAARIRERGQRVPKSGD